MNLILSALYDAVIDTVKLIPFLFVTYLLMELLERKTGDKAADRLSKVGALGPVFGAAVGVVPQCGFSAAAASLFSGGVISVGTLIAVFLSTSDEMLPIFISEQVPVPTILKILGAKVLIGVVSGFAIDAFIKILHFRKEEKKIHDLCEDAHCGCEEDEEGNVLHAALMHTLQITLFIFVITVVLTLAVEVFGAGAIEGFLTSRPVVGVLIAALIGLIPNCAASVTITQMYLAGLLGAGQMMAGLLVSAGVGLLVLFRTNSRHLGENLKLLVLLYAVGVAWGLLIEAAGIVF